MLRQVVALLLLPFIARTCQAEVIFDWAQVGNAGNSGELTGFSAGGFGPDAIVGAVAYNYAISKTEVTNAQYAEFLNAVAANDSFSGNDPMLYNASMGSTVFGGITRSGVPGSYSYTTKPNMANKPVHYVSFYDSMRFTNWLHNGQGSGGTETGAYTIGSGLDEARSAEARYWIPSEDEWYKAAYHNASAGTSEVYFDYATASNNTPTVAAVNNVGDISNPGINVANYAFGATWNGQYANVTTVASAGISSSISYGTFDQGGNVMEWNEAIIVFPFATYRGARGGAFVSRQIDLQATYRGFGGPALETAGLGFRIATIPEPTTATLLILAAIGTVRHRR